MESLLKQRYYKPGEDWPSLVERVINSTCNGEPEHFKKAVRRQLLDRVWLPNSPCLMNAGTKNSGLFACFVVGPTEDKLEHHVEVLGDIAAVGKRGGGCGFSGTFIRPKGAHVAGSTHGYAYGPNAWATRVADYLEMITHGGARNMALMYSISSDHKDLDEFIGLKQVVDERFCNNFNQSVFATDSWMRKATNGPGVQRDQFRQLANNAWNNGEPGLLFADTINTNTPYTSCGCEIYTTNPCGEEPLPPYGSCNLASINISHPMFINGGFDYGKLSYVVGILTRFLDNVGSATVFPNDKFRLWYEAHRPIGVGIMGYADALLQLGIRYGSDDSLDFLNSVMTLMRDKSYTVSAELGMERGIPEHCYGVGRRNITTTTVAPTGSIAVLAGCSHGIEPVFSPKYRRTDERGETYLFTHEMADEPHFMSSINTDKEKMPTWKEHVDVQLAAQQSCDSGVSKTINMVNGVTKEDVHKAMTYAWESGCKGITVYRDGSRNTQVLEDLDEKEEGLISCPSGVCEI